MANPEPVFRWPLRVYYEDTDLSGVVYHANYLKFFERARTEWLRALGCSQERLRDEVQVVFTVSRVEVAFLKPARLDDALEAMVTVVEQRRASLGLHQALWRVGAAPLLLATAEVRVACVDAVRFKPVALPEGLRARIAAAAPASC